MKNNINRHHWKLRIFNSGHARFGVIFCAMLRFAVSFLHNELRTILLHHQTYSEGKNWTMSIFCKLFWIRRNDWHFTLCIYESVELKTVYKLCPNYALRNQNIPFSLILSRFFPETLIIFSFTAAKLNEANSVYVSCNWCLFAITHLITSGFFFTSLLLASPNADERNSSQNAWSIYTGNWLNNFVDIWECCQNLFFCIICMHNLIMNLFVLAKLHNVIDSENFVCYSKHTTIDLV